MMFDRLTKALIGLAFFAVVSVGHALDLDAPIPVGPQVNKGQLANGLTYYVQKNTKPAGKTELRLVIKAGSAMEDDDQKGLAHLLEHMAFNGSTHFKKHELISYLQSMGLNFGADLNAYTTFNETVYILSLPTVDPQKIAMGVQVLEDWAHGLTLDTNDIDAERSIVIQELRSKKGVQERILQKTIPKLFQGSRYAERLPIGNEHDLKTFHPDSVRRFYREWYRPNLMSVVAVGDFDPVVMEGLIKKHFEPLKNPTPIRASAIIDVPARTQLDAMVVTDSESSNEALQIVYPVVPSVDSVRLSDYRNDVVEQLFNTMMDHRLSLPTQQAAPPFLGGSARFQTSMPGYKSLNLLAGINRRGLSVALDALIQEVEQTRQQGFTVSELERAKKNYQRNLEQVYTERSKTESHVYAAEYIRNFLVNESIPGIVEELRINKELLPTIDVKELNAFAQRVLPTKNDPALMLYIGSSNNENTPTTEQLKGLLAKSFSNPVRSANVAEDNNTPLLSALPKPGTIVSVKKHPELNTAEFYLSNGLRVLVKPTQLKDDQILLSATRLGGQSLYGESDKFNAAHLMSVADAMGLGAHSPTALASILAGTVAQANAGMGMYTENVSGQASQQDASTMFELLHLRFSPMRKDNALFTAWISRMQDMSKHSRVIPEVEFSDALAKATHQNHSRIMLASGPEDFANISLDRVEQMYNERFGSAKGFDFILVGNIEPAQLRGWLEKYFASLPTTNLPVQYRDLGMRTPSVPLSLEVKKGREPKSLVTLTFAGAIPVSDQEQMQLQLLMDIMNLRIVQVLREQKTLIYSGSIQGSLAYAPYEQFFVRSVLPSSPENSQAVVAAMEQEIRALQATGPSAEEMTKAMNHWLAVNAKSQQDNEYWLGQLQGRVLYNKPLESILHWKGLVMNTTAAEIQAAAKKYLPLDNYILGILSPAEAAKAGE